MHGTFQDQGGLFSYVLVEDRVPAEHPLRKTCELVRAVLVDMNRTFTKMYADEGRPSIPREQLLGALLLQAFYGVRSERQLRKQLDYNLLFCWFVGLAPDAPVWVATTFTKNRERLQAGDVFKRFMTTLLRHPQVVPLLSNEHFSVDGTLIEAGASHKSFRRIGIFDALYINNQKRCVGVPTKALSNLANPIFLRRPPEGYLRPHLCHSIFANNHNRYAIWENQTAASATGICFSEGTKPQRKYHINQRFLASSGVRIPGITCPLKDHE